MSELMDKGDVFLPGQGDRLSQVPAYHWETAEPVRGQIFRSTSKPEKLLVHLAGLDREERLDPDLDVIVDASAARCHDYDGFGVHLPGLIVTQGGTAIAICGRRHGSMADCGHDSDVLVSRSTDEGRSWSRQEVLFAKQGYCAIPGAIFEDRVSGAVLVAVWGMPASVADDLGYFRTLAEHGGAFWLLKSTDEGVTWSAPIRVCPRPSADGWVGWPSNGVHGIQLQVGTHRERLVIPALLDPSSSVLP